MHHKFDDNAHDRVDCDEKSNVMLLISFEIQSFAGHVQHHVATEWVQPEPNTQLCTVIKIVSNYMKWGVLGIIEVGLQNNKPKQSKSM